MSARLVRVALAACLGCGALPLRSHALPAAPTEHEVKAAFLYNFARFVEWPKEAWASPDQPFVVGVLGEDPFGETLDRTLAGKTVAERPIVVRRLSSSEGAHEVQILFVSSSEGPRLARILYALTDIPVLTVGEPSGFAEQGGMIGFRTEDRRIRFDINTERAQRAGLRISSQLLKLARIVGGDGEQR